MASWIQGSTDIPVSKARYDSATLDNITNYYGRLVDSGRVKAAGFLLARDGKVFAHKTCGKLHYTDGDDTPYRPESIKQIASITKLFTSTAIMQLVERGAIWLAQPVKDIIPEFDTPMHKGITIWNLLTHTSGLAADNGYWGEPYPIDDWEAYQKPDWLKKAALAGPVQCKPGEQWNYCSTGFVVLAEIVSRVSGEHFNSFVEKNIFNAIGMERSFLEVPEKLWGEVMTIAEWSEFAMKGAAKREGSPNGGGGVFSTLYDLFKFGQCYMDNGTIDGKRLVGKKTAQEMTRNQLDGVPSYHWGLNCKNYRQGLGWEFFCDGPTVGPATYNHEGWGWCSLFVDPVERFVFVSMLNDANEWSPDVMVKPRTMAFAGID
jgi:CubicO group peptidase (beta-lactamase class C family)